MRRIAHTLDGRLLCAAECAYAPSKLYLDGVGWKGSTAVRITKSVNSCLVGTTIDGIVVAFRGTQPNSALDWLEDAAIFMANIHGIPGRIHSGFYLGAHSLFESVKSTILDLLAQAVEESTATSTPTTNSIEQPLPRILLTGHSKGASLASLTAILINNDPDLPNVHYVASFGGARVGDTTFQAHFNQTIRQRTYENYLDIVPFLPPGKEDYDAMGQDLKTKVNEILWSNRDDPRAVGYHWGFQSIGRRRYIDESHKFHDSVTKQLDRKRIYDIETKNRLNLNSFHRAHCSACPNMDDGGNCAGGYFCAVAPEICKLTHDDPEVQN